MIMTFKGLVLEHKAFKISGKNYFAGLGSIHLHVQSR